MLAPPGQCARTFSVTVIAVGGILTLNAAVYWTGQPLVASYIVLAALASTMKVRLPGIPGTFSANCLVTVLAIAQLSAAELVFVGVACALVQSWWQASRRPTTMQVLFNAGVFAISGAISGWTYGALVPAIPDMAALVVASCAFFVLNTGIISVAMSCIEGVSPMRAWWIWHVWSLPYYLINVALAVLILTLAPTSVLLVTALAVPFMLGSFAAYRWLVRRFAPEAAQIS